jgi:hypothetical protein
MPSSELVARTVTDVELPNHLGQITRIADYIGKKRVVLVLLRGLW